LRVGNNEKAGKLGSRKALKRGAGCAERVACYENRRKEPGAEEIKLEGLEAIKLGGLKDWQAGRLEGEGDGDVYPIAMGIKQGAEGLEKSVLNSEVGTQPSISSDESKSERKGISMDHRAKRPIKWKRR
jgi:hypothetical protein